MSIRFEPCPVHEPTGVEYEKPAVFNDESGRWACAVCGAEGVFKVLSEKEMNADFEKKETYGRNRVPIWYEETDIVRD